MTTPTTSNEQRTTNNEPVVAFAAIEKSFFGVKVLKGVSFSAGAGRIVGLVGENGAGKSTLMNLLGGILQPDVGSLRVDGQPYAPRNPNDARAHSELGFTLLMSGRPADGLIHLSTAIRLDPAYDEPHYFAGVAYRSLKRTNEARQEFEAALQINPKHARAHGNLGLVLAQQGDIARAAEHFRAALQLNPEDDIARTMLQQAEQALRGPQK